MKSLWQNSILASASLAAIAFCVPANAQDEASTEAEARFETVQVTGFRGSLAEALTVKRESSGVVDAIVAEDIAAFPDLNLAESIQRIPGISIDRVAGEGRQITVRGLNSTFTRIRINGMEALATTGASDSSGGSNRDRAFDFNTFASDLFNEIRVTKTTSASMDEGSLGATVDLNTARPFDYGAGLTAAGSAQIGYNDVSEEFSPRYAGLLSWTNAAEDFGVLFSVAFSDRTILEEGFSTVRWQDANWGSVNGNAADINAASEVFHPRIPRYGRLEHDQQRLGLTGSVQFMPTPDTTVSLDGLYSKFDGTRTESYLEVFFRSQEGAMDVTDYNVNSAKNIMDYGVFNIPQLANGTHPIRSESRFDELTTEFTQFTAEIDHDFSDRLRGNAIFGTVESEFDNPVQTTIFFDAVGPVTGYSFDFRKGFNTPEIDFGSLDVTDPSQFAFTEFRDRPQSVKNTFDTIAGSLEYDLNEDVVLSAGLNYKKFEFSTTEGRRESTFGSLVCNLPDVTCPVGATGLPITPDISSLISGYGNGLGMPSGTDKTWLLPNVKAAADLIGVYDIAAVQQAGNTRSVQEEDMGYFVQADFTAQLGQIPVRGDVGIRYVETSLTSTGQVSGTPVTIDRSYEDTLPSLNLAFELTEDVLLRTSVAKVMSRPALGNLTPGGSLDSFNGPPYRYNAGNPDLDPFRATAYDISLEWYFAEESLIAFSAFYKDLDSFNTSAADPIVLPYSQTGLPASLPPASSPLYNVLQGGGNPDVEIRRVENGGSGSIQGYEIAYQQPFFFLPGFWSDFGFQGNFTHVESDDIRGFSPNAYNATLYYENDTFSARLSAASRDAYITTPANSIGRQERGYDKTFNLDFASSYKFNDQIDFTFEAINLTDEFEHQVFDAADLVNVYHHTGTEFLFGARYKY